MKVWNERLITQKRRYGLGGRERPRRALLWGAGRRGGGPA